MNCSESEQFFDAYLDDELSGSLRLEFDAHRLRCPICQQKLAMMEACEHIIAGDSQMPDLSGGFADRVMNQISDRRLIIKRVRRRRLVIGSVVALQAAAVIVFAVVLAGVWTPQDSQSPPVATNEVFVHNVGEIIEDGNKFELDYAIRERLDQWVTARSNVESGVNGLARFAASVSLIDELNSVSEAAIQNPLESFLGIFAPSKAEESEPTPTKSGPVSL